MRLILTVYLILGPLATIALIGRPRQPVSVNMAIITTLVNSLLIVGIWAWM